MERDSQSVRRQLSGHQLPSTSLLWIPYQATATTATAKKVIETQTIISADKQAAVLSLLQRKKRARSGFETAEREGDIQFTIMIIKSCCRSCYWRQRRQLEREAEELHWLTDWLTTWLTCLAAGVRNRYQSSSIWCYPLLSLLLLFSSSTLQIFDS